MFILFGLLIQLLSAQGSEGITWQNCSSGKCVEENGFIVIDQEFRGVGTPTADFNLSNAGITVSGNSISVKFKTGNRVGSRSYLIDGSQTFYPIFKLVNAELTLDVDLSQIPCGMNAAVYTSEIPAEGVTPGHEAGARYGGGYCDANYVGGIGCAEFDILEANSAAIVYTSHGCTPTTGFAPQGSISCDTSGTSANPYREDKNFYGPGPGFTIDTTKKFTVVTQFKGTSAGLTSIDRIFIQDGRQYPQPNNISTDFERVTPSFNVGHVLVFTIWASDEDMSWLDAGANGPCDINRESSPYLQETYPNATATFSNVKDRKSVV